MKNILTKICIVCGKKFESQRTTLCSSLCRNIQRGQLSGWGLNEIAWSNVREYIIERDDYKCQDCGIFSMNIGLVVHHVNPIFMGGDNDPENLVTLCVPCHKERHRNYEKQVNKQ